MTDGSDTEQNGLGASTGAGSGSTGGPQAYRVLARKYRPSDFSALIGQEALVRTFRNAVQAQRLAQAWMLTGVRGVGKTTTARLIAKALNCVGPDGSGGVTDAPCNVCDQCRAITEDRHVDVLEMDAASRTGVNDIREILDGVRYRPGVARYKVYIIDEVHMLSTAAFNALLKTLEEPPEHVKFIFATTEIRKVPVTVLSRCQRFDLRRVSTTELSEHFAKIAKAESAELEEGALRLIARAADGSVRDGLSLLDQAIAHGGGQTVSEAQVTHMLGLADRIVLFDLLDALFKGQIGPALEILERQYALGADPTAVLRDLLELVHRLTRIKAAPDSMADAAVPEAERTRGVEMAGALTLSLLNRAWQILLNGLQETRAAPMPLQAVEMVLIRFAYASALPSPEDALKGLASAPPSGGSPQAGPAAPGPGAGGGVGAGGPSGASPSGAGQTMSTGAAPDHTAGPGAGPHGPQMMGGAAQHPARGHSPFGGAQAVGAEAPMPNPGPGAEIIPLHAPDAGRAAPRQNAQRPNTSRAPKDFRALVNLFEANREMLLFNLLYRKCREVQFRKGYVEINPLPGAPSDLAGRMTKLLGEWTGQRWVVSISDAPGLDPLDDRDRDDLNRHPLVAAIREAFPGAEVETARSLSGIGALGEGSDLDGDMLEGDSASPSLYDDDTDPGGDADFYAGGETPFDDPLDGI